MSNNRNNTTAPNSLRSNIVKAAIIAVVAMFASWFIPGELTTLEVFTPKEKASDFSFSDFYTLAADNSQTIDTDPDVTIVALDGCRRSKMGWAISLADSLGAMVIGIDLLFNPPTTPYDSLIAAIDTASCIVLPIALTGESDGRFASGETSYFEPLLQNDHYHGAVNINGISDNSTTRFFKAEFPTHEAPVPSFATVIAELYRPGITDPLIERGNRLELIDYPNKAFNTLTPETLIENEELIRGRIVLMGYVDDKSDIHRTPLVNNSPGLLIHATIISTILKGDYISYSPQWLSLLVAFAACFLMVFAGIHFREHSWGAVLVRAIQIMLMIGVLYIGSLLFIDCNYSFDFMPTITVTIIGLVIMDIAIGLGFLFTKLFRFILSACTSLFRPRKNNNQSA